MACVFFAIAHSSIQQPASVRLAGTPAKRIIRLAVSR